MHATQPSQLALLILALGGALAMPAWAQSTDTTRGQDATTQGRGHDARRMSDSQADANGGQAAQSSSANTQSDVNLSADTFSALDTDHDGRISSTEAAASSAFNGRFKALDRDGDGYVSRKEYRDGLRETRTPPATPGGA